jgi:hypothetical protein
LLLHAPHKCCPKCGSTCPSGGTAGWFALTVTSAWFPCHLPPLFWWGVGHILCVFFQLAIYAVAFQCCDIKESWMRGDWVCQSHEKYNAFPVRDGHTFRGVLNKKQNNGQCLELW